MNTEMRAWWRNCPPEVDEEIKAIDSLEDSLGELDQDTKHIRNLISCLELCHHKVERHVDIIITAIGKGRTDKGPGRRLIGQIHPREALTEMVIGALLAWCRQEEYQAPGLGIGGMTPEDIANFLGERTDLRVWQVERMCDKLHSFLDPEFRYYGMAEHPEYYRNNTQFLEATVNTVIHDKVDGKDAEVNLALAIDHLQPCNWNFPENLVIVLEAIGGKLKPKTPFAAHSRNRQRNPVMDKMSTVSNTLKTFYGIPDSATGVDASILNKLGKKTPVKHWLAACLDKTIRMQMRG